MQGLQTVGAKTCQNWTSWYKWLYIICFYNPPICIFIPIPELPFFLQKMTFQPHAAFSNNTHLQHPSSNWDLSTNHRGGENPKLLRLSANDMVRVFGWYNIAIGGVGIRGGWLVAVFFVVCSGDFFFRICWIQVSLGGVGCVFLGLFNTPSNSNFGGLKWTKV